MLLPLLTLAIVALSQGAYYEESYARLYDEIKSKTSRWQPGYNERFEGMTKEQLVKMLGFRRDDTEKHPEKWIINVNKDLPNTFDARDQWKQCADNMGFIRDQSVCGSCWAVSSAEVVTDRTCIGSNGTDKRYVSDEDILSCCGISCGFGCNGGFPLQAFKYWTTKGIVTGGPYGSDEGCLPYEISPEAKTTDTPKCEKQCESSYNVAYTDDKEKGKKYYAIKGGPSGMQQELFDNGPIVACFDVYEDFKHYQSGVYHHVSGEWLGGHAVKVIGWGTEDGTPYWLAANSWNTTWADLGGFFKIQRGNDECGFEDNSLAGLF